jgi:hypothetical protein
MRDIFKKLTAVSMVAGAALALSACGTQETANTADNSAMTDMNAMAPMEGSMNDMTAVDMGNDMGMMDSNMSADNAMDNSMTSNMM